MGKGLGRCGCGAGVRKITLSWKTALVALWSSYWGNGLGTHRHYPVPPSVSAAKGRRLGVTATRVLLPKGGVVCGSGDWALCWPARAVSVWCACCSARARRRWCSSRLNCQRLTLSLRFSRLNSRPACRRGARTSRMRSRLACLHLKSGPLLLPDRRQNQKPRGCRRSTGDSGPKHQ